MVDFRIDLRYKLPITAKGVQTMSTITVPHTRLEWLEQKIEFLLAAAEKVLGKADLRRTCLVVRETNQTGETILTVFPDYVDSDTGQLKSEELASRLAGCQRQGTIAALGISLDLLGQPTQPPPKTKLARFKWLGRAMREIWGENPLSANEYVGGSVGACVRSTRPDANAYTEISVKERGIVTITLGLEYPL